MEKALTAWHSQHIGDRKSFAVTESEGHSPSPTVSFRPVGKFGRELTQTQLESEDSIVDDLFRQARENDYIAFEFQCSQNIGTINHLLARNQAVRDLKLIDLEAETQAVPDIVASSMATAVAMNVEGGMFANFPNLSSASAASASAAPVSAIAAAAARLNPVLQDRPDLRSSLTTALNKSLDAAKDVIEEGPRSPKKSRVEGLAAHEVPVPGARRGHRSEKSRSPPPHFGGPEASNEPSARDIMKYMEKLINKSTSTFEGFFEKQTSKDAERDANLAAIEATTRSSMGMLDTLTGKVMSLDSRISVLETRPEGAVNGELRQLLVDLKEKQIALEAKVLELSTTPHVQPVPPVTFAAQGAWSPRAAPSPRGAWASPRGLMVYGYWCRCGVPA